MSIGMAWFYNPILCRFLRIGLFAVLRRHYDPAATVVHKSAFSPRISQLSNSSPLKKRKKTWFSMACFTRPISAHSACGKSRFVRSGWC